MNPRRVLPSRFCFVFAAKNEEKKTTNKKRGEMEGWGITVGVEIEVKKISN